MLKNEIYYSLSKYEIKAIEHQIKTNRKTHHTSCHNTEHHLEFLITHN